MKTLLFGKRNLYLTEYYVLTKENPLVNPLKNNLLSQILLLHWIFHLGNDREWEKIKNCQNLFKHILLISNTTTSVLLISI